MIPGRSIAAFTPIHHRALLSHHSYRSPYIPEPFFSAPSTHIYDFRYQYHLTSQDGKESHGLVKHYSLLWTLLKYGAIQANKPRDGLYGLLWLCLDVGEDKIGVDYQASLPKVYAEAARFCIDKYANIDFLCHCRLSAGPFNTTKVDSFPSWLLDWRIMDRRTRKPTFQDESPQDGGASCPQNSTGLSNNRRCPFVRAFRVDVITSTTDKSFSGDEPFASVLEYLRDRAQIDNIGEDDAAIHTLGRYDEWYYNSSA